MWTRLQKQLKPKIHSTMRYNDIFIDKLIPTSTKSLAVQIMSYAPENRSSSESCYGIVKANCKVVF